MRLVVRFTVAVALCAATPFDAAPAANTPSFQELEESLTCQCGCGLTVHSCNHLQCPSAIPLRQEIRAQMQAGKSKQEILAYFAQKYGEKILSAPTATGFNLTAWILPFAVVAVGAGFVVRTLRRWQRKPPRAEVVPAVPAGSSLETRRYEEILERELSRLDEEQ